ncbi:M23 family metallopeptidase [Streptomyces virginiae]|uniref:M23 family metallopeptidase n=1 Tax=Streptomyces sp. SID1046 TaxID=2690249 RepID=UPI001928B5FE|nr:MULTISPECIES: M23 family metallopeptidase [Streptomyces]MCX4714547.1 M23 family metallopeptidase [Streptomyces virginiae]MCX5272264.1 M23 family metallopeptidase [Streptomyces virginiae]
MPAPEGIEIQEQPPTAGAWGEWNPTEDSVRPVRGKHRVAKQRGGLARSSTVLGVGVIAAVGAGGIATAQDRPQVAISLPALPDMMTGGKAQQEEDGSGSAAATGERTGIIAQQSAQGPDAGEVLRNRILQQAESQQDAAEAKARADAELAAQQAAAQEAKQKLEEARKAAEEARTQAEAKAKEEAEAKAAEAAAAKAEQERLAQPSGSYSLPTSAYTLTSHYGDSGSMWSSGHHTGLDFAAPTGTPAKAVAAGKITSAGWSGAYGYRIVLELPDGTEIWYCHLSSMSVTSGTVGAGETIGRVGATGNVTGPHLHLEVRKGGSTQDPLAWLNSKGLTV